MKLRRWTDPLDPIPKLREEQRSWIVWPRQERLPEDIIKPFHLAYAAGRILVVLGDDETPKLPEWCRSIHLAGLQSEKRYDYRVKSA